MSLLNIRKKRCYPEVLEHTIKKWHNFLDGTRETPMFNYLADKVVLEEFLHRYQIPDTIVVPKENGKALVLSYIYSNHLKVLPSLSVVKFFNKLKEQLPDFSHIQERYSVEYDTYIPKGIVLLSLVEITTNDILKDRMEKPPFLRDCPTLHVANMPDFDMDIFKKQEICLMYCGISKVYSKVMIYY